MSINFVKYEQHKISFKIFSSPLTNVSKNDIIESRGRLSKSNGLQNNTKSKNGIRHGKISQKVYAVFIFC